MSPPRLYGKNFFRNSMDRMTESKVESRDAIVYDVLPEQKVARVKIQGSAEYIIAYYPRNWEATPFWLKKSNAVSIRHTGGVRSRVELVGQGTFIPTPMPGDSSPAESIPADTILTGCAVTATDPTSMFVQVSIGTFRIGGTIYSCLGA